jgi:hypothetical protein
VFTVGSGSQAIVHEAREGLNLRVSRIVVGVDFGDMSGHTVREAAQLAARWGAKLELLYAVDEAHGVERWRRMVDEQQRQRVCGAHVGRSISPDRSWASTPLCACVTRRWRERALIQQLGGFRAFE